MSFKKLQTLTINTIVVCLLAVLLSSPAFAQYQKMASANSANLSAYDSYASIGWSKQLNNRNSLTFSGFYFQNNSESISTNNFSGSLSFNRWLFRLGDFYLNAGGGIFIVQTAAKSKAGNKADDFSFGLAPGGNVEYYPMWWLVFFGEIKQMFFFSSDYFSKRFVVAAGVRFVF